MTIEKLLQQFPNDHLLLIGNMNLPGIDWHQKTVKPPSQDRHVHKQFLDFLAQQNFQQLINQPTHIHGNTLGLDLHKSTRDDT